MIDEPGERASLDQFVEQLGPWGIKWTVHPGGSSDMLHLVERVMATFRPTALAATAIATGDAVGEPPGLADAGRHFGLVTGTRRLRAHLTLFVDQAEWFVGDAARQAAREDGQLNLRSGYYIRNATTRQSALPLDEAATIRLMAAGSTEPQATDIAVLDQRVSAVATAVGDSGARAGVPAWLTVKGGAVVAIEEQPMP
jgi:hypothetical protein